MHRTDTQQIHMQPCLQGSKGLTTKQKARIIIGVLHLIQLPDTACKYLLRLLLERGKKRRVHREKSDTEMSQWASFSPANRTHFRRNSSSGDVLFELVALWFGHRASSHWWFDKWKPSCVMPFNLIKQSCHCRSEKCVKREMDERLASGR